MSGSLRVRMGVGLAAAVLLAGAGVGALQLRSEGPEGPEVLLTAGASGSELATEPVPTTVAPTTIAPSTVASSPVAPTTAPPTTAPPATAPKTTAPAVSRPPPTAAPVLTAPPTVAAQRTFTISPGSGTGTTSLTANGTGCIGAEVGVSLTMVDPAGAPFNGDGGAAKADGTWSIPFSIGGNTGPGVYTVLAHCRIQAQVLFAYPPQPFTVTG